MNTLINQISGVGVFSQSLIPLHLKSIVLKLNGDIGKSWNYILIVVLLADLALW